MGSLSAIFKQAKRISLKLALRCNGGVENKGVFVQSNEHISVMGNNQLRGWSGDVFLVNALWDISTEFIVVSREPTNNKAVFSVINNNNNGPNGHLFYVGGDLMMRRGMLSIIMLPDGDLRIVLHLVPF